MPVPCYVAPQPHLPCRRRLPSLRLRATEEFAEHRQLPLPVDDSAASCELTPKSRRPWLAEGQLLQRNDDSQSASTAQASPATPRGGGDGGESGAGGGDGGDRGSYWQTNAPSLPHDLSIHVRAATLPSVTMVTRMQSSLPP